MNPVSMRRNPFPKRLRTLFRIAPHVLVLTTAIVFGLLPVRGLYGAGEENPSALIKALDERKILIEKREAGIEEREGRLYLLEEEIRGLIKEYTKLKEEFEQREADRLSERQQEEEKRLDRLAKIFQSMPPKEAANRISKLKESTALALLRRIKEKDVAKILSNLTPAKAAQYSEKFIKVPK